MTRWRLFVSTILIGAIVVPLFMPVWQLVNEPAAWSAWRAVSRILFLSRNTFFLTTGTLALCLPAGIAVAILVFRTDLPLRRALRALVVLTLFIPLPLFTSGWQAALGSGGWMSMDWWNAAHTPDPAFTAGRKAWSPWGQGLGTAICIHAAAGLPWVIWLVGLGLIWVDRELDEDALTAAGSWRVLWRVTLPRAKISIAAAALWVAVQTATEITVTDVMQVRTFAEEVYSQFVMPDVGQEGDGLARALAVAMPMTLIAAMLVLAASNRWERTLPPSMAHERQ
ncbi:MAG: hypothetical protein ACRD36_09625, partial [Candidatus Acidiferrum sp.]